jgi:hypothetical protein
MTSDRIYATVKEDRGWYFVEYYPANKLIQYSVLNLVVTVEVGLHLSVVFILSANPHEFSRIKAQIRVD